MVNTRAYAHASLRHATCQNIARPIVDDWSYPRSIRVPRKRSSDNARAIPIAARHPREHNTVQIDLSFMTLHVVDSWSVLRNYRHPTNRTTLRERDFLEGGETPLSLLGALLFLPCPDRKFKGPTHVHTYTRGRFTYDPLGVTGSVVQKGR